MDIWMGEVGTVQSENDSTDETIFPLLRNFEIYVYFGSDRSLTGQMDVDG